MARLNYRCYGLDLCADREIPGLDPAPPASSPIAIHFARLADSSGVWTIRYDGSRLRDHSFEGLRIRHRESDGTFHLEYADGTEFWVSRGDTVWCHAPVTATVEDVSVYLRGPVLGLLLRARGVLCLHASAIDTPVGAIAIA